MESRERVLRLVDIPVPTIRADDVRVRVQASSVNALDWHCVTGTPMFARVTLGLRRPTRMVPGADIAGIVDQVGSAVTRFKVGDEVFGQVDGGGFAEYVVAPADWLVASPPRLSQEEASTIGVAALTALQGLRDWGGLRAGQRVLVIGSSGGVGTFAVQLAKALGASHVTAVCSTANVETAKQLGADRVHARGPHGVGRAISTWCLTIGSRTASRCRRLLSPGGTYVMTTGRKSRWLHPLPRLLGGLIYFKVVRANAAIGRVADRSTPTWSFSPTWRATGNSHR